jgi:tetratricopeptide (TPR) repeat protein
LACIAGLAAVAIESLVDFPFQMPTPAFMAVTLAGILVGLDRRLSETLSSNGSKWECSAMALVPVVCLVAVACIIVNIRFLAAMSHTYNAHVAKKQGQGAKAVYEIDQAMAWSDWHYSVRREYGVIHSRFNPNREQALLACRRALADDAHYINNLVNTAGVEMDLGRLLNARDHLEHALRINNKLHLAHYALGLVNLAEGKPDAARASFQACLRVDPGFKPALERLTSTSRAEGR